jgi:hypothetical protein
MLVAASQRMDAMNRLLRCKRALGCLGNIAFVLISLGPASCAADFEITFGVIGSAGSDDVAVLETTEIPLRYRSDGYLYGVKIAPTEEESSYEVRFVHKLPAAPESLTGRLADDDTTSGGRIIEGSPHAAKGATIFPFGFDKGDPSGDYQLKVVINDKIEAVIDYSVVNPEPLDPS